MKRSLDLNSLRVLLSISLSEGESSHLLILSKERMKKNILRVRKELEETESLSRKKKEKKKRIKRLGGPQIE